LPTGKVGLQDNFPPGALYAGTVTPSRRSWRSGFVEHFTWYCLCNTASREGREVFQSPAPFFASFAASREAVHRRQHLIFANFRVRPVNPGCARITTGPATPSRTRKLPLTKTAWN